MKANMHRKNYRKWFLNGMTILLVVIGIMIVFSQKPVQANWLVVLTCLINIVLFLTKLVLAIKARPFSFDMMVWLFNLFFFGYVPLLQHFTNKYTWNLTPTFGEIVGANLCVLLWSVCYIFGRQFKIVFWKKPVQKIRYRIADIKIRMIVFLRKKIYYPLKKSISAYEAKWASAPLKKYPRGTLQDRAYRWWIGYQQISPKWKIMDLLLVVSILLALFDLAAVGFSGQFSRSTSGIGGGSQAASLLLNHGLNNTLLFVATIHIFSAKQQRRVNAQTIVALLCFLIACFPTGLARNMMASFYAGMLVVIFDRTKKGRWFSLVILVGIVLIFPAVEIFRRVVNLQSGNVFDLLFDSVRTSYLGGHFDAHQNIVTMMRYVDEFGITWGKQLLGAVLFFVPRSVWPNKPVGTGHMTITALSQNSFTNVSMPIVAEGFVNFGVLGVILFGLVIGKLTRKLDKSYWERKKGFKLITLLYPHAMFMFFFMLRGDLMSSWAYTFAQCVVGAIVFGVYKFGLALSVRKKEE